MGISLTSIIEFLSAAGGIAIFGVMFYAILRGQT